ncbi:flippase [soil metagenome]
MSQHSGSRKKTLVNFFSVALLQAGNYVLPMITLPIISRIIGPEKYGIINYCFAFVGYFVLFINAGFDFYGTRMITANRGDKKKINNLFSSIIISKIYLLIISIIIFAACIFFIPQLEHEKTTAAFTFLICIGWVINPSWLYNGMQDSRKYAVFSFISKLAFSIAVILVVRHRDDYIYHPLITSVAHVLVSLVSFFYAMKKYNVTLQPVKWLQIKTTLKDNRHLSIIWWITNQALSTNIVIAGLLLTTMDLGYYSAALRLIIIIQSIVSMPLNTVLFPYIGEAFIQGYENGISRIHKAFPYICYIAVGITVGTFLFAKPVILIFYGNKFYESILLLKISSLVLLFNTINSAFGQQIMLNLKKDTAYVKFILTGLVINILLLFIITKSYSTPGAAFAWPLSELVVLIGYVIYFKSNKIKIFNISYYSPKFIYNNMWSMIKMRTQKHKPT